MRAFYRSKKQKFRLFHKPIHYKPRQELDRSGSSGDEDYTSPPAAAKTKIECIELKQNEEEKDKDYYFMDTSLLG